MDKDKESYIRYLKLQENVSISEIARRAGVDRKTVRRVLYAKEKNEPGKRASKLDAYKEEINRLLEEKPYISNVLIYEAIKKQGYSGGRSILGDYLLQLRSKRKEAFNHLETLPGAQAQVDWACCGSISCGAQKRRLYLFCMVLSYSRYMYITFTTSMDSDSFMACHIKAFRYFGGVPNSLLYDNLKSVVAYRYGKEVMLNERFLDFSLHYGSLLSKIN
jgi:transposase